MIENQIIQYDDHEYEWVYDEDAAPEDAWEWVDTRTYTTPPRTRCDELNLVFRGGRAPSLIPTLDDDERYRFFVILRGMGTPDLELFRMFGIELPASVEGEDEGTPARSHKSAFNDPVLRDAMFMHVDCIHEVPRPAVVGSGPFEAADLAGFLRSRSVAPLPIDPETECFVIGHRGWSESDLDDLIDQHIGRTLRVYSQEMFIAFMATGRDPFHAPAALRVYQDDHPALRFISQGWPGWVSAIVEPSSRTGRGTIESFRQDISPLRALGYAVGKKGAPESRRRFILRSAFEGGLPNVGSPSYMAEWGDPGTPDRLHKIATFLASMTVLMKRRGNERAASDYERDLVWCKEHFYHGHMRFAWPSTYVM